MKPSLLGDVDKAFSSLLVIQHLLSGTLASVSARVFFLRALRSLSELRRCDGKGIEKQRTAPTVPVGNGIHGARNEARSTLTSEPSTTRKDQDTGKIG